MASWNSSPNTYASASGPDDSETTFLVQLGLKAHEVQRAKIIINDRVLDVRIQIVDSRPEQEFLVVDQTTESNYIVFGALEDAILGYCAYFPKSDSTREARIEYFGNLISKHESLNDIFPFQVLNMAPVEEPGIFTGTAPVRAGWAWLCEQSFCNLQFDIWTEFDGDWTSGGSITPGLFATRTERMMEHQTYIEDKLKEKS